jgi:hypothetical protein
MSNRYLLVLALAACGGSSSKPADKPAPPAAHSSADLIPVCKRIFARKATCADDYLPLLLDLRAELDKPPGIGDQLKANRTEILAAAHTELVRDTAPEQLGALCDKASAQAAKAPPELLNKLLEQAATCEAAADCKAFAPCVVAIDRGFMAGANQP